MGVGQEVAVVKALEGRVPKGRHLPEGDAQRPHVGLLGQRLEQVHLRSTRQGRRSGKKLWGHPTQRQKDFGFHLNVVIRVHETGKPEISNL